jgi:hypothetical protein
VKQKMRLIVRTAVVITVIICLLAFSGVPALAANTANIAADFNAKKSPPRIVSITPASTSVLCTPDGTTTLRFTVRGFCSDGYQDLAKITAQIYKGTTATPAGALITVTANTPVDSKQADFTVDVIFQHYWMHGSDYAVTFRLFDQGGMTDTKASVAITYEPATGIAMDSTPTLLSFGDLNYTESSTATTNFHNSANTPISVAATAPSWTSDDPLASSILISSLQGKTTGAYAPMPIAAFGTSGVGTLSPGDGAPPASVTTTWQMTVPPETPTFVLVGEYSTTITLTATATG